jgi:hypothetical protein
MRKQDEVTNVMCHEAEFHVFFRSEPRCSAGSDLSHAAGWIPDRELDDGIVKERANSQAE